MNILVLNHGSATLKFGLYQMPDLSKASTTTDSATVLAKDRIFSRSPGPNHTDERTL